MAWDWVKKLLSGSESSFHFDFLKFNQTGDRQVTKQTDKKKTESSFNTDNSSESSAVNNYFGNVTINHVTLQLGPDGQLPPETIEALKPVVDKFNDKQLSFVTEQDKQLVRSVVSHEQSDPDTRGVLKFFNSRLNSRDYQLLRTGLYLKFLRDTGETIKVKDQWKQVTEGSSLRERRIIELASADYFSTFFRPLYKEFERADRNIAGKRFDKEFESILDDMNFAIFVHSGMSQTKIIEKVTKKAISNIKYGVRGDVIAVHATGATLVGRVRGAVKKLRQTFTSISIDTRPKDTDIIKAEIQYRQNSLPASSFDE